MFDANIMRSMANAAQTAAQAAQMGGAALTAARAVLDLVADLRTVSLASPKQVEQFEASRQELERAINAHADRTAESLG